MAPRLLFWMPSGEPTIVALGETPVTVGRRPNCTIVLDDIRISGSHVHFKAGGRADAVLVEDTSANGTFVNGRRLTKGEPRMLRDGDVISLVTPLKLPPQQLHHDKRCAIIAVFICNGQAPSQGSVAPTAAEATPNPVTASTAVNAALRGRAEDMAAPADAAGPTAQAPPPTAGPAVAAPAVPRAQPTPAAPAAPAAAPAGVDAVTSCSGWHTKVRAQATSAAAPSRVRASCGGRHGSSRAAAPPSAGGRRSPVGVHGPMEPSRPVLAEPSSPTAPQGPAASRSCRAPVKVQPSPGRACDRRSVANVPASSRHTAVPARSEHASCTPAAPHPAAPGPARSSAVVAGGSTFDFDAEEGNTSRERLGPRRLQHAPRGRRAGRGVCAEPGRQAATTGDGHMLGLGGEIPAGCSDSKRHVSDAGVEAHAKRRPPPEGRGASGAAGSARTSTTLADVFSAFHGVV